jgi:hypothetical protein
MSGGSLFSSQQGHGRGAVITARVLAERFGLPLRVAQEIEMTAIWRAARRSWACWSVLALGLAGSIGLMMAGDPLRWLAVVLCPIATSFAWRTLARRLAAPAMLAEAARRATSPEAP